LPNVALAHLSGEVLFDGQDVARMPEARMRSSLRRSGFSMIFQDPLNHLNLTRRIAAQMVRRDIAMLNVMDSLIRPRTVAVIGASSPRSNNGNVVLTNLRDSRFNGLVIPVHAEADELGGYPTAKSIDMLTAGTDVAVVSIPASGVPDVIRRLDRAGVRSAIVMSNGFTPTAETELRRIATAGRIVMHGPNCMGLVNMTDGLSLYTANVSSRVRRGPVALLARSGSAAIAVMNSANVGFSKVVTLGSEFRVTSADYLRWLAHDDETSVLGVVMESIQDPGAFADALDLAQAVGSPWWC
jgi:acetate---CoA ligase (ADP-forming)